MTSLYINILYIGDKRDRTRERERERNSESEKRRERERGGGGCGGVREGYRRDLPC